MGVLLLAVYRNIKENLHTGFFEMKNVFEFIGTVKYYAQIHLQVWQNSSLHRAGKPALNYLVAEDRERVKGGEACRSP